MIAERLEPLLPWFILIWAAGVVLLSIWNLGGWIAAQRLKVLGTSPAGAEIAALVERLGRQFQLSRPVRVLESLLADTPIVIGWLRPVILIPGSVLTGLSPAQLEAVLAHELAHVRRHDCLVNLFQIAIETLLFYHPAVWWISRQIRLEREQCCDDVALTICHDRCAYAGSLAALEEVRLNRPLAMAATGSGGRQLLLRVRRVLGLGDDSTGRGAGILTASLVLLLGALTVYALAKNPSDVSAWYELACRWEAPATTLKYSEDPDDAPAGGFTRQYNCGTETIKGGYFNLGPVDKLPPSSDAKDAAGVLNSDCLIFVHERTSTTGIRRVIAIADPQFGSKNELTFFVAQIGPSRGTFRCLLSAVPRINMNGLCGPGEIRLFSGQIDPKDPSRFSIPFACKNHQGWIDGVFRDQSVELTVRAPFRTPEPSPASATQPAAALMPVTPPAAEFGPVIERIVNDRRGQDSLLNLKTGKFITVNPEDALGQNGDDKQAEAKFAKAGVDVKGLSPQVSDVSGLRGFDLVVAPVIHGETWNNYSPEWVRPALAHVRATSTTPVSGNGGLPATYLFRTREEAAGILQIVGFTKNPGGVKIRYKLVEAKSGPATEPAEVGRNPSAPPVDDTTVIRDMQSAGDELGLAWYQLDPLEGFVLPQAPLTVKVKWDATPEQKVAALAVAIQNRTGAKIGYYKHVENRPCIVLRQPTTSAGIQTSDTRPGEGGVFSVIMTGDQVSDERWKKWSADLLQEGRAGRPGSRTFTSLEFASHSLDAPILGLDENCGPIARTSYFFLRDDVWLKRTDPQYVAKLRRVLDNLQRQVGGDWRIESRDVERFTMEAEASGAQPAGASPPGTQPTGQQASTKPAAADRAEWSQRERVKGELNATEAPITAEQRSREHEAGPLARANTPSSQPAEEKLDAGGWTPELSETGKRMKEIGLAALTYASDHDGRLPPTLGETLPYIGGTPTLRAGRYLLPHEDAKALADRLTVGEVDRQTTYDYLAGSIELKKLSDAAANETAMFYTRLQSPLHHPKDGEVVVILWLDGHAEIAPVRSAKTIIEASERELQRIRRAGPTTREGGNETDNVGPRPTTRPTTQPAATTSPETRTSKRLSMIPTTAALLDRVLPEVEFEGEPFSLVVDYYRNRSGANIFVYWNALEAAGVSRDTPVTVRVRQVKLGLALELVLRALPAKTKLGFKIEDGSLDISTAESLIDVVPRVYNIGDLLADLPNVDRQRRVAGLVSLIEETVAEGSWKDTGGNIGSIQELGGQLVIRQSTDAQRQIAALLDQIHHGQASRGVSK